MSYDTVSPGPPTAQMLTGPQGLILDSVNNVVYSFGKTQTAVPLLGAASILPLTGQTTATSATGGAATALPADPVGYLEVSINGTVRKIPYYAI